MTTASHSTYSYLCKVIAKPTASSYKLSSLVISTAIDKIVHDELLTRMPGFISQTGKIIVKKNQFRLIGLQSEASMSSYHQIQEENKVIAQTIRMELLVTNLQLEISKYSQPLNNSSLLTNTQQKLTLSPWSMEVPEHPGS